MKTLQLILILVLFGRHPDLFSQTYTMPAEDEAHEGTWLQWPHQYEYGTTYRNRLDATWVAMCQALVNSEKVHIVAYNSTEKTRIINLLNAANVPQTNVDFFIHQTNDVWVRDNGPIYVRNANGDLLIEDWGFNGWGGDYNFAKCDPVPADIATASGTPVVNLNNVMIVEGGACELDGKGVLLATKSSILSQSNSSAQIKSIRNPGMTQTQAEAIFTQYLGVTKFIWLDGAFSTDDITDFHIDGFAKFINDYTLLTMSNADLTYWGLTAGDITTLNNASNISNTVYTKVYVPLTQNDVTTAYGNNLGYKGSYANYYVGNTVVLVPNYNDPSDAIANAIIQAQYPGRTVVGIDVRNLYENGGMVHCVTQQQPAGLNTSGLNAVFKNDEISVAQNFPNPFSNTSTINISLKKEADVEIEIYNSVGQLITTVLNKRLSAGEHTLSMNAQDLENGVYNLVLKVNNKFVLSKRMVLVK